jgi:hypothetical protein
LALAIMRKINTKDIVEEFYTSPKGQDLIILIVADNPIGESCYYPDSRKWLVRSPESRIMRSDPLDYYEAEE